jgi:oligosaccharide translocation protein RFT1
MLFQPIEETSRNLFAKICAPEPATGKPSKESVAQAKTLLQSILKLCSLISLVAITLGWKVAPLLLRFVAGARWADTEASDVLATYCYYIPLLAVNGIAEAFVASTASNRELHVQSIFMGVFFVGFAGAAYVLLHVLQLGAQGLVWSNCVNMALRIAFGFGFIVRYFRMAGDVGSIFLNFASTTDKKQTFDFTAVLPSGVSIALGVGVANILARKGFLTEPLHIGGISGVFGLAL